MAGQAGDALGARRDGARFGELVRGHRKAAGLTQESLAYAAELSARTVGNLERGRAKVPQRRSVEALAGALGLTGGERAAFLHASTAERALRGGAAPAGRPTAQLPAEIPDFIGRAETVAALCAVLRADGTPARPTLVASPHCAAAAGLAEAPAVAVLTGPAGSGKTATALRAAHRVGGRFPDGQVFLDLQGRSRTRPKAADLLGTLLRMLGVPAADVPVRGADRRVHYRELVAGRRFLLVLDDAADAVQVASLLPQSASCGVLVTSRRRLRALPGRAAVGLTPLAREEAAALLARLIGPGRAQSEPEAVEAVVTACAGLPLALRAVGSRLAGRPTWGVAALADRLAEREGLLDELAVGDLSVRQVLRESYRALPVAAGPDRISVAGLFRLLGTLPGERFCPRSLASRLGRPEGAVAAALGELAERHLLEPAGERRLSRVPMDWSVDRASDGSVDKSPDRAPDRWVDQAAAGGYRIDPLVKCFAAELAAEFAADRAAELAARPGSPRAPKGNLRALRDGTLIAC